jgi:protein-tyrosine-phosphatase
MTAAMLRRRLRAARVESAGVLGHDDDPPTGEAIATMEQMRLDIADHRARTMTEELAAEATLIVAVDSGTARVARARFPEAAPRIRTLGELAGTQRDIPDPFKMQIGAWLAYAREIDQLIAAALPRIREHLPAHAAPDDEPAAFFEPPAVTVAAERSEAAQRIAQLIAVAAQMPGVVDWAAARGQIEAALDRIGATPAGPGDMVAAYTGLLRAALALTPPPPSPGKLAALADAVVHLAAPITTEALAAFSARLGGWTST